MSSCIEKGPNHIQCGTEPQKAIPKGWSGQTPQKRPPQTPGSAAAAKAILKMCAESKMEFVASALIQRDLAPPRAREELAVLRRCDRHIAGASPLIREDREGILTAAARDDRAELFARIIAAKLAEWDEELEIASHLPPDGSVRPKFTDSRKIFASRRLKNNA
jgi:hypothetical protein